MSMKISALKDFFVGCRQLSDEGARPNPEMQQTVASGARC